MNYIRLSPATLLSALSVLLASPDATAQTVVNPGRAQGHFSTWAVAFTSPGQAPGANDPVQIRAAGIANGNPRPWNATDFGAATPEHPDLSTPALTHHWASSVSTPVEFGGFSSGSDLMPRVEPNGELDMAWGELSHWLTLTATVDNSALGVSGSMVSMRRAAHTTHDGDIISYYAIGSELIHPQLVDAVYLESSSEQLHLSQVPNGTQRITNLDYGFGVETADWGNSEGRVTIPVRNKFYFTLTRAWIDSDPATASLLLGGAPPNASTVYVMTWSLSQGWSAPAIAFSHDELFPEVPIDEGKIEIDAIAVDQAEGPFARTLVFSLTKDSDRYSPAGAGVGFDQILVYQHDPTIDPATGTPVTLTARHALMTDGVTTPTVHVSVEVSNRMGLVQRTSETEPGDELTSLCTLDPKDGDGVNATLGRATTATPQGTGDLGLSVFRTCVGHPGSSNDDLLTIQVTGLDYSPWLIGGIQLFWENGTPFGSPVWIDPAALQRNTIDLTIPRVHVASLPASGARFCAKKFGIDFTTSPWSQVFYRQSWFITIGI